MGGDNVLTVPERERQIFAGLMPAVKHAERVTAGILSALNPVDLALLNPACLKYLEDEAAHRFHDLPVTVIELGAKIAILNAIPNDVNIDVAYARREVLRSLLKAPKRTNGCESCGR